MERSIVCMLEGDQAKCWVQKLIVLRSDVPLEDARLIFEIYNLIHGAYTDDEDPEYAGLDGLHDEILAARKNMQQNPPELLGDFQKYFSQKKLEKYDSFGEQFAAVVKRYPKRYQNLKQYEMDECDCFSDFLMAVFGGENQDNHAVYWLDMTQVNQEQFERFAHELRHLYLVAELFAPGDLPFDLKDEDTVSIFGTEQFEAFADCSYGC